MRQVLVIDNYDSFIYNLVFFIEKNYPNNEVTVRRNDKISMEEIDRFDKILLSPGPGVPEEAGIMKELIRTYAHSKSIFGVCLGMQAIGEVFNCELANLENTFHGVATEAFVTETNDALFKDVPQTILVGRYHSWVIHPDKVSDEIKVTAKDASGEIMAIRHSEYDVCGVQFHPESVLTKHGEQMICNWMEG